MDLFLNHNNHAASNYLQMSKKLSKDSDIPTIDFDNVMKRMVRVKLGEVLPPFIADKEPDETHSEGIFIGEKQSVIKGS